MPYSTVYSDFAENTTDGDSVNGESVYSDDTDTDTDPELVDGNENTGEAAAQPHEAADVPAPQEEEENLVENNPHVGATPVLVDPKEKRLSIILDINYRCPECLKYYGNLCIPAILKCGHHICSTCLSNLEKETVPPLCKECTQENVTTNVVSLKTENHTLKRICEEYSQLQTDNETVKNEYISFIFEKIYKVEVENILGARDVLKTHKQLHSTKLKELQTYYKDMGTEIGKVIASFKEFYQGAPDSLRVEDVTNYIRKYDESQQSAYRLFLETFELCKHIKSSISYDKISDFSFTKEKIEAGMIPREIVAVMEKGNNRLYYRVTTIPEKGLIKIHSAEECSQSSHATMVDYDKFKDLKKYENYGFFFNVVTPEETLELRFHYQLDCLLNLQITKLCVGEAGYSYKGSNFRLKPDSLVVPEYRPIEKKKAEEINNRKASDIIYGIPDVIKGAKCQVGSIYSTRHACAGAQLYVTKTNLNKSYCVASSLTNVKLLSKVPDYAKIIDCGIILYPKP